MIISNVSSPLAQIGPGTPESHGGRIGANSDGGRGATFHFTLPVSPRKQTLPTVQSDSAFAEYKCGITCVV
jgi:hypothetical protein